MPYRRIPLVTGEIYHVFNRSVAKLPIFTKEKDYQRALEVLSFYSYHKPPIRYSHYNRLPNDLKLNLLTNLKKTNVKQIQLLSFCLMPNHVHFLIKEIKTNGISTFMSNFQNSYAKYFNIKSNRNGSVFQNRFKAVRIESDEQLLHVCRYIHLNPLTSYLLKDINELEDYEWSSFPDYLYKRKLDIVDTDLILNFFSTNKHFKKFTADQVDYQRRLDRIKHLTLE